MVETTFILGANPRGRSGRADLLQALALSGGDVERETEFALALGFERRLIEGRAAITEENDVAAGVGTQGPTAAMPKAVSHFRPHRLVNVEAVVADESWRSDSVARAAPGTLRAEDSGPWDSASIVPGAEPVVPWTRLWPKLRESVAKRRRGELDIRRLTALLADGRSIQRLPRSVRLLWPEPLPVVFDFSERLTPYWDDWHRLADRLAFLYRRRVRLYCLKGVPQTGLRALGGRGFLEAPIHAWTRSASQGVLLIASDLGMVDPSRRWPRECWLSKLAELRHQGVEVVVLAPISTRHEQPELVNVATVVRLSGDSPLRPLARRLVEADPPEAPSTELHPAVAVLLAMMSIATRVEPGLLRALRRCLPHGAADAGLDGEVWCRPELDTAATACAVAPYSVQALRKAFSQLPPALQNRALDCLRAWHAALPQAIHHEETLLWRRLAEGGNAEEANAERARRFFQRLGNTLRERQLRPDHGAHALQVMLADRHVHWLAPSVGRSEPYLGALSSAIAMAEPSLAKRALPEGIDPVEWLRSLPAEKPIRVRLNLGHQGRLFLEPVDGSGQAATGRTPLAEMMVDRSVLLWSRGDPEQAPEWRPWRWADDPPEGGPSLRSLPGESNTDGFGECLRLHTGQRLMIFEPFEKPGWAPAIGQGGSGLFAEVPWLGNRCRLVWEPPRAPSWDGLPSTFDDWTTWEPPQLGRWRGDGPVGWDDFGLYADLTVEGVMQRFRWIEPGTFLMGSPPDEPERSGNETQHEVRLTRGYWLADTACTQAFWVAVVGENPSRFQDDPNHPAENVSWNDVAKFLEHLNVRVDGLNARLPTEAEWEYACRAGTTTPFSFGGTITPEQVNYAGNHPYSGGAKSLYRETTVPVKSLPANSWGLYEMHGNVWEWCADWYGDYPPGPLEDPSGPPDGAYRLLRGGSWIGYAGRARSAYRSFGDPSNRINYNGFRLALGQASTGQAAERPQAEAPGRTTASERGGRAGRGPFERLSDWIKRR